MKNIALILCVILCIGAVAGASALDVQANNIRSVETILPAETFDAAHAALKMNALYERLVASRAETAAIDLGQLTVEEASYLARDQITDTRKLLVGIDRQIGAVVDLADSAKNSTIGALRTLHDGSMVWTSIFHSPGASAVRAHLTDIDLPEGAELFAYGQRGEAFGPYTGSGSLYNSEIWTNTVVGDTITLQLEIAGPVTKAQRHSSYFMIDSIGHMGDSFDLARWQGNSLAKTHCTEDPNNRPVNADCVMNAECGSVGPAGAAQSAIAAMLYKSGRGYYLCSGGLLSNGTNNPPAYFLTANHCISKGNEASSLETYWDHKAPCGTTSCDFGWAGGRTVTGASILSTNRTSDYTLMQLNSVPSNRAFLGWTNAAIANNNGAGLHRISHPAGSPQAYSRHDVDTNTGTCQSWPRGSWIYSYDTYGATEGGSSGSPVLNDNGLVVGQLSGACGTNLNNTCDAANNATVDGALASYFGSVSSWLDGGTACIPTPEVCDGEDNDCNDLIDDGIDCGGGSCTLGQIGDSCTDNASCCSNKCRGRGGNKSCR